MARDTARFYKGNTNVPMANQSHEWTEERIKAMGACRQDIQYFAENFFFIVTLDEGKRKIKLYDAQKRVLNSLVQNLRVCLLASRQIGKTTLMCIYALWIACFQEDKRILLLANKEKTAKNIFQRIRLAYELLPTWLKPGVDGEYGKTGMLLDNGSSIAVAATSSSSVRGDTANVLILDEIAFVPHQVIEEFWNSSMPVISSSARAQIFMVSTPNGTQNKFYDIYSGAEREENGWKAERVDWWEVPNRDEAWKARQIQTLGGDVSKFAQEFGNQFIEVGQSPFRKEIFDILRNNKRRPQMMFADSFHGFDPVFDPGANVTYKVWEKADKTHVYVMGVDVAEGVGARASVASVLDITDLTDIKMVAQYHSKWVQPSMFATKLLSIARQYGTPLIACERNNMGGQVIDELHKTHGYQRIVNYDPTNARMKYYTRLGIYSHTNAKWNGVTNMRYWFDQLEVVRIYDIATIQEFETFIRHPNGTWGRMKIDTAYDDRVDSIIWALFLLHPPIAEQYLEVHQYDETGHPRKVTDPGSIFVSNHNETLTNVNTYMGRQPLPTVFFDPRSAAMGAMSEDMIEMLQQGWSVQVPGDINNGYRHANTKYSTF